MRNFTSSKLFPVVSRSLEGLFEVSPRCIGVHRKWLLITANKVGNQLCRDRPHGPLYDRGRLGLMDIVAINIKQVLIQDHKIGLFAHFD